MNAGNDQVGGSIGELTAAFGSGALSPVTVLQRCLDRIEAFNGQLNAFVQIDIPRARLAAEASAARWAKRAPLGPLDGIPFSVKNNLLVAGYPMRRGSCVTPDTPATENAPAVQRCLDSGAVFVGLTTMPEFAIGPVTISPLTGITRNAWNAEMQAGGSSGGAAVAVAAGFCHFSLATDAGGSIRIPAAMNGVTGFKPSAGVVPAYPSSAISALACVGPITRNVADAIAIMNVITKPDARDAGFPLATPWRFCAPSGNSLLGLRCALSPSLGLSTEVDGEIARLTKVATEQLRGLGATVDRAEPPVGDPAKPYLTLVRGGYQFFLRQLSAEQRKRLSDAVLEVLDSPAVTLEEYLVAQQECAALAKVMAEFHNRYDLLVAPVTAAVCLAADRHSPEAFTHLSDRRAWAPFTALFNITHQPAISIPVGLTRAGMPVGIQLVAAKFGDQAVLETAHALEAALQFDLRPPLTRH